MAAARKLAVIAWHVLSKDEDYAWVHPALTQRKYRDLELKAGIPSARGRRGQGYAYNQKSVRDQELAMTVHAERTYARFVSRWQPQGPKHAKPSVKRNATAS